MGSQKTAWSSFGCWRIQYFHCIIWGSEKERHPSKLTQLGREETGTLMQGWSALTGVPSSPSDEKVALIP